MSCQIAPLLLPWFEQHGRKNLPWQQQRSPYRVWLSEIMLQQTQVATVIPYFERFIHHFSSVTDLANASQQEVLKHWAGLGYYARARNLHKTAELVRDQYQGVFPQQLDQLMALPGIGRSTAGAILSLAHNQVAPILDGNVKRVLSRLFQVEGWSGQASTLKSLWTIAETQTPETATRDYNQAMMDLGAMVCVRSKPDCESCPLTGICRSHAEGTTALFPQPKPKKQRPHKHRWLLLHTYGNQLLLEHRPQQGIWGGLWSLPELESMDELESWQQKNIGDSHQVKHRQKNLVKHQFSHFDLSISIAKIPVSSATQKVSSMSVKDTDDLLWVEHSELKQFGLPAPVYKILSAAL